MGIPNSEIASWAVGEGKPADDRPGASNLLRLPTV